MIPALFTSTSTRPGARASSAAKARMLPASATSSLRNSTSPPSPRSVRAAASPLPVSRAARMTLKPARASPRLISSPMPRLAPVTTATFMSLPFYAVAGRDPITCPAGADSAAQPGHNDASAHILRLDQALEGEYFIPLMRGEQLFFLHDDLADRLVVQIPFARNLRAFLV